MVDIRNLDLEIVVQKIQSNTNNIDKKYDVYWDIENRKCKHFCNFPENELFLYYLTFKYLKLSDIYIGKAYDLEGKLVPNCYGIYSDREKINDICCTANICCIESDIKEKLCAKGITSFDKINIIWNELYD